MVEYINLNHGLWELPQDQQNSARLGLSTREAFSRLSGFVGDKHNKCIRMLGFFVTKLC